MFLRMIGVFVPWYRKFTVRIFSQTNLIKKKIKRTIIPAVKSYQVLQRLLPG